MRIVWLSLVLALGLAALAACGAVAPGQTQVADDLTVRLQLEPARPLVGEQATLLLAAERAGAPLEGARFSVTPLMPAMGHPSTPLAGQPLGAGASQFQTRFAMAGQWELRVAVSGADHEPELVTFTLDVE